MRRKDHLIKYAEKHGFSLLRIGKHHVYKHQNGAIVVISSSPGEPRGDKNKMAEIRRLSKK